MATNRQPDLLLVNPCSRMRIYQSLGKELSAIEPPIWAGLLASFVRRKGFEVLILDAEAEDLTPDLAAKRVVEINPKLTAVVVYGHNPSASTQVMPGAGAACRAIKELASEMKVMMLGGHVSALPERTMREEAIDFAAGGEGFWTLADLLGAIDAGSNDWSQVRDLWYRDGDHVAFTRAASLVTDLTHDVPGMAWDLLPMKKYRSHNWHALGYPSRQPYAAVYTTLGCPYKCSFCCIQAPFKSGEAAAGMNAKSNSYRFWDPKLVVDELELLVRDYGVTHMKFADEMFVLNVNHVSAVCDGIVERGLPLNIWAYARVDTVKDGLLPKLKNAGVNWLALGIEAASERVRRDVQKAYAQKEIHATIKRIEDAGIHVIANFIFGLPEDDLSTMQETLDLALELNCEFANFYCTMAYPGSSLYQMALKESLALPETWAGYSQHSVDTLPLATRHLSSGQVITFRDAAFQQYYNNPRYLQKVEKLFGSPTLTHIREMTAHQLQRRYAEPLPMVASAI